VPVPGLGVHGGQHPVAGDLAHHLKPALFVGLDVLPGDQREQLSGLHATGAELLTVDDSQRGERIDDQRVDQRFPGCPVVPVTRRLADRGVVIIASQRRPDPPGQRPGAVPVQHQQQTADRSPQPAAG